MDAQHLYKDILGMLTIIKDDEKKLLNVLTCVEDQIIGTEKQSRRRDEISPDYKDTILQIADSLYNGFICYLNPDTLEIEQVQRDTYLDNDDYSELNDDMLDEYDLNFMKWDSYIKFEPPGPNDLLRMMEKYVSQLKDSLVGFKLVCALDDIAPISSFMKAVNECKQEEDWTEFRQKETVNYVNDILMNKLQPLINVPM